MREANRIRQKDIRIQNISKEKDISSKRMYREPRTNIPETMETGTKRYS